MAVPHSEAPRRSRVLSFTSNKSEKSHKTNGSGKQHMDLTELPKDKEARRMHTKADPTLAMTEAQPATIALEKSNMESLRMMQHKDVYGNPIVDPDLSNPTRHRLERPLDTIRSFEAAIDGSYNNRRTSYRPDESPNGYSRRSSYFGDSRPATNYQNRPFNEQSHHYNIPGSQSRPDSYSDPYGNSNGNHYNHPHARQPRAPRHNQRMNNDPAPYAHGTQNVYPQQPAHTQSYDNVTAASGSASHRTDQWGNSTDPSSVNSSLDRLQQQQQRMEERNLEKAYNFNGFGGGPQLDYPQLSSNQQATNGSAYPQSSGPPPVPRKQAPVAVAGSSQAHLRKTPTQTPVAEKKKSWFKKRFSKG